MSDRNIFYKMRHAVDDQGIVILTKELVSIHESECWHWCVEKRCVGYIRSNQKHSESMLQAAKRYGGKIYKVAKVGSRVAFNTEQKAFEHFMMLKRRQIDHMKREIEILEELQKKAEGLDIQSISSGVYGGRVIPNTHEVVNSHYLFE